MKLHLIRFIKSFFIYCHFHIIYKWFRNIWLNMYYLVELSSWASQQKKLPFNDFWSKWDYEKRYKLYDFIIEECKLASTPLTYLEFGVAGGNSFRWWMKNLRHPESRFYGFDTFEGLPEDWGHLKKGAFTTNNQLPLLEDDRGTFFKGLFQETLPGFIKQHPLTGQKVILLDADIFSATLYTLTSLSPFLEDGDILIFDEFNVPTHEFRAYHTFIRTHLVNLEVIGAASNYYFVAFRVIK